MNNHVRLVLRLEWRSVAAGRMPIHSPFPYTPTGWTGFPISFENFTK